MATWQVTATKRSGVIGNVLSAEWKRGGKAPYRIEISRVERSGLCGHPVFYDYHILDSHNAIKAQGGADYKHFDAAKGAAIKRLNRYLKGGSWK